MASAYRIVFTGLLVLGFVFAGFAAETASDANKGVIKGRVLNAKDRSPVVGANVVLRGTNLGAATDLDSYFEIRNIPPGSYALEVSAVGYEPAVLTDQMVSNVRPVELDITLQPTTIQLEEVKVTAGFFRKPAEFTVSTITQSNEEIRRLPGGFEDVVRAVSILPGVAQATPGRNDLVVRGGAPSENLYLLDNIPLNNINHFGTQGASGGPQSFVNLDFIERTTFNTGGFGVRYGDKLSSVMTVDLRKPRSDRIGGKATVAATQFGFNLEGPIRKTEAGLHNGFLFSARRSYLDLIFKAAGFGFVPEYWDFLGKVDYDLGPRNQLSATGVVVLDKVVLFNDEADQRYNNADIPYTSQNQYIGGLTWKRFFDGGFTTLTLGKNYVSFNIGQNDSLLKRYFRNESYEDETSLRGEVVFDLTDDTRITTGVEQKLINFNADIFLDSTQLAANRWLYLDEQYTTTTFKSAGYVQAAKKWGFLTTTLGGRVDYFDLIEDGFAFSPRFSATYQLLSNVKLNASAGRYHQAPSYIWLVANEQNRKLKQIGADQFVIGTEYLLRRDVRVQLEGYYKDYFNYPASTTRPYLVLANTGAGFGGATEGFESYGFDPLVSKGEGWSRGVELLVQKKTSEHPHYGTASLTYSETFFTALDGVERPGAFDQRWIFNIGWGFMFAQKWEASAKFRLATGRPYTPYNPDGSRDVQDYFSRRTGINHGLDVRLDRFWNFDNYNLITYIDIQNIYNRKTEDIPQWDEREQRAIDEDSIGILPTIGISLEF